MAHFSSSTPVSVKKSPAAERLLDLISEISRDYPNIKFKTGEREYWSPANRCIYYNQSRPRQAAVGILHELAHAILDHRTYGSDFELLRMETQAWQKATELGKKYKVNISSSHIENCLNTYRDWLHARSHCPACGSQALQIDDHTYRCTNCQKKWRVSSARFHRPYRLTKIRD